MDRILELLKQIEAECFSRSCSECKLYSYDDDQCGAMLMSEGIEVEPFCFGDEIAKHTKNLPRLISERDERS